MRQLSKISIVLFLLIGKAVGQDFTAELKLENSASLYPVGYSAHALRDTRDLKRFDYKTDASQNVEIVQYYLGYFDVHDDMFVDTLNVAIYRSPTTETRVVIDANRDHNFKNDREYIFNESISSYEVNLPFQIDTSAEGTIDTKSFLISRVKETGNTGKTENFKIFRNWIYKGKFKLNNEDGEFFSDFQQSSPSFSFKIGGYTSLSNRLGNTVLIGDRLYATEGDRTRIYFKDVGKIDYTLLLTADHVAGKQVHKDDLKGKYLLYDFWGSWCEPCINGIPDLKALKEKYGNNLKIISIAYENSSDLSELEKLITHHKMDWPQLYYLKRETDPVKNGSKYYIKVFPTFVLLDPQGKMVTRVEGTNRLKEVADILQAKLK